MPKDNTIPIIIHILGYLTSFIGPLVFFYIAEDKYTKDHARMALNWQFSYLIYMIISVILVFIFVGIFTLIAVSIVDIVFIIIAAVKAGKGELWKYPLSIPFFKV